MSLLELKGNIKKTKKRVGRGNASGHGTYSCRGMKGQSARTGGRRRPGFEGGQTPYLRKMPKLRGFKNPNYVTYQIVNVGQLNVFDDGSEVTLANLLEKNLVSKKTLPIKLLGGKGTLEKKLTLKVDAATASAIKAVEGMKGSVELPKKKAKPEEEPEKAE